MGRIDKISKASGGSGGTSSARRMRDSAAILALAAFVENLRVSVFAVSSPFGDGARGFSIARGVAGGSVVAGDLPLVVAGVEGTEAEFFD